MIVRPWRADDTNELILQSSQHYLSKDINELNIADLSDHGLAWSGVVEKGVVIIAGIHPIWANRAVAWALISSEAGPYMINIHRAVKRFLTLTPYRRIEATIDVDFEPGKRWVEMLGFEFEGYLKSYLPNGADQLLYARTRL